MTDPYRLTDQPAGPRQPPAARRAAAVRWLLWTLLAVSLAGNTVVSLGDGSVAVHLALGAVAVLCLAALAATSRRRQ